MTVICLYFGTPEECQWCGGWTKSLDEDGHPGPFEGDSRFCSEDCFAACAELATRLDQARQTVWCPACGYDNHEHAPDCPTLTRA